MISGSTIFLFFKVTSGSCTITSTFPDVSSLIASPLSTISCSILARHSSVCCQIPHPAVRPYLSKMFCRRCKLFARLPLANSSFCWIVGPCCSLLSHSTDCQHTESRIANLKHHHLQDVSHNVCSLLLLASTAGIHRCGQACRQKTPRIHLMFNLAPSSEWFRPKHTSPNGTTSPMSSLSRIER